MQHLESAEETAPPPRSSTLSRSVIADPVRDRESSHAVSLVVRLCEELDRLQICYCHWKSNDVLERSESGQNDLDLLIDRPDAHRFHQLLYRLGFKEVRDPVHQTVPGIRSFYGCDPTSHTLIHVHAHYRLVLGHDMNKNVWLPVEQPYLESRVRRGRFWVPSAEWEWVVFVIRMTLKHSLWESVLGGEGRLSGAERREWQHLRQQTTPSEISRLLTSHLNMLDAAGFQRCEAALSDHSSWWQRVTAGRYLQRQLRPYQRRVRLVDLSLKLGRRVVRGLARRLGRTPAKSHLPGGGLVIAIAGGDGAGKTSTLDQLQRWLGRELTVQRFHFGKPPWSLTTRLVRAVLKIGHLLGLYCEARSFQNTLQRRGFVSPGYPWLIREVCRARDRNAVFRRARRHASRGAIVLLDRCPLPGIHGMDCPQTQPFVEQLACLPTASERLAPRAGSRLTDTLIAWEEAAYRSIGTTDAVILLRVSPETAVQRKVSEDAEFVRRRNDEIYRCDFGATSIEVVDAEQSCERVISQVKAIVWSLM